MQKYVWKADQILNLDNILTKLHWRLLTRFRIELSQKALMIIKNLELEEKKQVVSF